MTDPMTPERLAEIDRWPCPTVTALDGDEQ